MNTEHKPYYDWHWLMIFIVSAIFVLSTILYMSWIFNEQKLKLENETSQHAKTLISIEERIKAQETHIKNIDNEVQVTRDLLKELKKISEEHFATHKDK